MKSVFPASVVSEMPLGVVFRSFVELYRCIFDEEFSYADSTMWKSYDPFERVSVHIAHRTQR